MKNIQDLNIQAGGRVLLRCDLNLPQDANGSFTDFFRLESSLPTMRYLLELGVSIFIISHLGQPKNGFQKDLSFDKLAPILSDQLKQNVKLIEDPFADGLNLSSQNGVFIFENLRFFEGEETNSKQFAKDLVFACSAEFFIEDAFGACHRNHASITQIPKLLPSAAGFLLQREVEFLASPDPQNLNLIIGGAKVESKLPVLSSFLNTAEAILTGGIVANTLLSAKGQYLASSLIDSKSLSDAKDLINKLQNDSDSKTKLLLPVDYLSAKSIDALIADETTSKSLHADQLILDIGKNTIEVYKNQLNKAKTIIWAGTLGYAENHIFAEGSGQVLGHLLKLKADNPALKIIIGGGDTVDFIRDSLQPEELSLIDHLSTGGGASLKLLSGQVLPGIAALDSEPTPNPDQILKSASDNDLNPEMELNSVPSVDSQRLDLNLTQVPPLPTQRTNSDKDLPNAKTKKSAPILVANLKAHFTIQEALDWFKQILSFQTLTSPSLNFSIAVPSIFLEEFSTHLQKLNLQYPPQVLAQSTSSVTEGSHTGQIAASMLLGIASGSLVGHSETRQAGQQGLELVAKEFFNLQKQNLNLVLCIGGSSSDPVQHKKQVDWELRSALVALDESSSSEITIGYEPVYAIGTGKVPRPEFLIEQLSSIKKVLSDFNLNLKILYGGSINKNNAAEILELGFDGLLVGSSSLNPEELQKIGINMLA
jgi:3-phosphoglycerate kinase/triosephosphate isomerase